MYTKKYKNFFNSYIPLSYIHKKNFRDYLRMENQTIRMKTLRKKYLKNMLNNQFLGLEKDFIELKDRELFHKPIIMSKDDMDKFDEQEMKKTRPIRKTWFDRLMKQNVTGKKPKIIRDKLKDKIMIFGIFLKQKKKKQNETIIKDRIIRDIRTLFEQENEEDYYKPKRVSNFWNNNYIEYKSNGDKNRNLSLDEHLNKIEAYLRNIIILMHGKFS